jgi:2-methylcitrate dehydratase
MFKKAVRTGLPSAPIFRTTATIALRSLVIPATRFALHSSQAPSLPALPRRAMSSHAGESTLRPEPDKVLQDIADYVHYYKVDSDLAFETARLCLIDTIGCGLEALRFPDCTKLLGPVVEGTIVPNGVCYLYLLWPVIHVSTRHARSGNKLPARSHSWSIQHWCCN